MKVTTLIVSGTLMMALWSCQKINHVPQIQPEQFPFGINKLFLKKGPLPVTVWVPEKPKGTTLRLYIEGDGRAWSRSGKPSFDPTPVNRLVHHLMLNDSFPDVAYLSQPCQYDMNSTCNQNVWTFGRYSEQVLQSMLLAMDFIKQEGSYQFFELIGYSGGGAMALLLTAHRSDVLSVRTVAGNLIPSLTNEFHGVSPIPDALNPVDFSLNLMKIPQIHFVGEQDQVIPLFISQTFLNKLTQKGCVSIEMVSADHQHGWIEQWRHILTIQPQCKTGQ